MATFTEELNLLVKVSEDANLRALAKSMADLFKAAEKIGDLKFTGFNNFLKTLNNAKGITDSKATAFLNMGKGIEAIGKGLNTISGGKLKEVSTGLTEFVTAVKQLPNTANTSKKLEGIAEGVSKLKKAGIASVGKGVADLARGFEKLSKATTVKEIDTTNIVKALGEMKEEATQVGAAFAKITRGLATLRNEKGIKKVAENVKLLGKETNEATEGMQAFGSTITAMGGLMQASANKTRAETDALKALTKEATRTKDTMSALNSKWNEGVVGLVKLAAAQARYLAVGSILVPLVGKIKEGFTRTVEISAALAKVMTVLVSSTDDAAASYQRISDLVINTSSTFGTSVNETSDALFELASAGLSVDESTAALTPVLNLAIGTMADMGDTAKTVAGVYGVFGDNLGEAATLTEKFARITDVLSQAFNISLVDTNELIQGLKFAGGVANQVGFSFEEVTAALTTLNDNMIKGGIAGRGLRGIFTSLLGKSDELEKSFGATFKVGDFNSFITLLKAIQAGITSTDEKVKQSKLADLARIFGNEQVAAIQVLAKNYKDFQGDIRQLGEAARGTAEKMRQIQTESLAGQLKILNETFLNLVASGLSKFGDALAIALRVINPFLKGIADLNNQFHGIPIAAGLATASIYALSIALITLNQAGMVKIISQTAVVNQLLVEMQFAAAVAGGGFGSLKNVFAGLAATLTGTVLPAISAFLAGPGGVIVLAAALYGLYKSIIYGNDVLKPFAGNILTVGDSANKSRGSLALLIDEIIKFQELRETILRAGTGSGFERTIQSLTKQLKDLGIETLKVRLFEDADKQAKELDRVVGVLKEILNIRIEVARFSTGRTSEDQTQAKRIAGLLEEAVERRNNIKLIAEQAKAAREAGQEDKAVSIGRTANEDFIAINKIKKELSDIKEKNKGLFDEFINAGPHIESASKAVGNLKTATDGSGSSFENMQGKLAAVLEQLNVLAAKTQLVASIEKTLLGVRQANDESLNRVNTAAASLFEARQVSIQGEIQGYLTIKELNDAIAKATIARTKAEQQGAKDAANIRINFLKKEKDLIINNAEVEKAQLNITTLAQIRLADAKEHEKIAAEAKTKIEQIEANSAQKIVEIDAQIHKSSIDGYEEQTKAANTASEEIIKLKDEELRKNIEVQREIRSIQLSTASQIRAIRREELNDAERFADIQDEIRDKLAEGSSLSLNTDTIDLAKQQIQEAQSLISQLPKEVVDANGQVIISEEESRDARIAALQDVGEASAEVARRQIEDTRDIRAEFESSQELFNSFAASFNTTLSSSMENIRGVLESTKIEVADIGSKLFDGLPKDEQLNATAKAIENLFNEKILEGLNKETEKVLGLKDAYIALAKAVNFQRPAPPGLPGEGDRWGRSFPGYGGGDRIPILAEAGERILRKEVNSYYAQTRFWEAIENMTIPREKIERLMGGDTSDGGGIHIHVTPDVLRQTKDMSEDEIRQLAGAIGRAQKQELSRVQGRSQVN